jgi:hypothetical protein
MQKRKRRNAANFAKKEAKERNWTCAIALKAVKVDFFVNFESQEVGSLNFMNSH